MSVQRKADLDFGFVLLPLSGHLGKLQIPGYSSVLSRTFTIPKALALLKLFRGTHFRSPHLFLLRLPRWVFHNRFARSFPIYGKLMPLMCVLITLQGLEKGLVILDSVSLYFLGRVWVPEVRPRLGRKYPLEADPHNTMNLMFRVFLSRLSPHSRQVGI